MVDGSAAAVGSLYVHVPFCARKCAYCAFYSEPATGAPVDRFVRALVRELELVAPELRPRTVFFGGGTPSLLTLSQWRTILQAMDRLGLLGAAEWTIECNPATLSPDKAKLWRDYGVNRVSLGVQSFDPGILDRLGRIHSPAQALASFDLLRAGGFSNINLDLMFAVPGQTMSSWQATLQQAFSLGSEHLSCYEIIYEEDTPLFRQLQAGRCPNDEDLACAMYETLLEQTAAHAFAQYEIANFARHRDPVSAARQGRLALPRRQVGRAVPGEPSGMQVPPLACHHNINYWRGGAYHGLGPSASGYVRGIRTKNRSDTQAYCQSLEAGRRAIESEENLPPLRRAGEIAAFGLRMNVGWSFEEFTRVTGFDLRQQWRTEMDDLVNKNWAQTDAHRFRLTPLGLRFADAAAQLFLR